MSAPTVGRRIRRNEDARLLTGRALFVDDVQLPGMLHVVFVRSQHAHGTLKSLDVSAARARDGVVAVYTAEDLGAHSGPRVSRLHAAAARKGESPLRGRAARDDRRDEPLHR